MCKTSRSGWHCTRDTELENRHVHGFGDCMSANILCLRIHMMLRVPLLRTASGGPRRLYSAPARRSIVYSDFPLKTYHARHKYAYIGGVRRSSTESSTVSRFEPLDTFDRRHIGPSPESVDSMLKVLQPPPISLEAFVKEVVPQDIFSERSLTITGPQDRQHDGFSESQIVERLRQIASKNKVYRSYIGCGYAGTKTPEIIKRNVLESPAWYTAYTPYQPEISQGRLESLLNFQTMVSDLTGLSISNASLLDEATAAAEAMTISLGASKQRKGQKAFFVSDKCHPQTLAVLRSRAEGFHINLVIGDPLADNCGEVKALGDSLIGVLVQYPDTEGKIDQFQSLADVTHEHGGMFSVATDLLALTKLTPPGEFGADVAFGNAQRFGVPFGYGGPHAAFVACSETHKRKIPGRLVGLSKDRLGDPAIRLALQTREQHIRRERATSNICTAQVLLAHMSAFYAIYHGAGGLTKIADQVVANTHVLGHAIKKMGYYLAHDLGTPGQSKLFDTIVVRTHEQEAPRILQSAADSKNINFRILDNARIAITLDETVQLHDLEDIIGIFHGFKSETTRPSVRDVIQELQLEGTGESHQLWKLSSKNELIS